MSKKPTRKELTKSLKTRIKAGETVAGPKHYVLLLGTRAKEQAAKLDAEKNIQTMDSNDHRHQRSVAQACIRKEHMESIIRNDEDLAYRTGLARGPFWFLVNKLKEQLRLGGARLWSFETGPNPENKCTLLVEHALLVYLTRIRSGRTQRDLGIEFGIDQYTISRYLDDTEGVLAEILPTARNVAVEMKNMTCTKEITVLIPGFDGTVIVDGMHIRIQRLSDADAQKADSGKKKAFAFNTAIFVTADGQIVGMSNTAHGFTHDVTELRGTLPKLEVIGTSMLDSDILPDEKLKLMGDRDYQDADKYCPSTTVTALTKEQRVGKLTVKQKKYNKELSRKRTIVKNVIGDLKEDRILAGVFVGTAEQYNNTFNVVTGLVNFKRMWPSRSSS